MARSTGPGRAAAAARTPARRSPARRKTPSRTAGVRPEQPAPPTTVQPVLAATSPAALAERGTTPAALAEGAAGTAARRQRGRRKSAAAKGERLPDGGGRQEVAAEVAEQSRLAAQGKRPPDAGGDQEVATEQSRLAAPAGPAAGASPVAPSAPVRALAAVAAGSPGRNLADTGLRLQAQMVVFTCRQAEASVAAAQAMLASRSLPALLSAQNELIGRSVENALAHLLELTRISVGALQDGAGAGR